MPQGKVVKIVRAKYFVNLKGKESPVTAILPGKLKKKVKSVHSIVTVGDKVNIVLSSGEWIITDIFERKNRISRISPQNRNEERILVSNIDQMLIVTSIKEPEFNPGLIDRYLVVAAKYNIKPVVVVNKVDLLEPGDPMIDHTILRFKNAETMIYAMSVKDDQYKKGLIDIVGGSVNAVVGSSGVGKSSLINYLDNEFKIKVGDISKAHKKGKHTTTSVQMFYLKNIDAYIVDTPGIREFGLFAVPLEDLCHYFPEFTAFIDKCKFNNCSHLHEPGCEIIRAVERGSINEGRYRSYTNIYNSIEDENTGY